ncbi:MAG: peptide chain release factor-like protein [Elusimicrobiota bacterium]|jgi:protein subunit release factor B
MKINEDFGVRPEKLQALKERIARLGLDLAQVEESFSKGGGKGGQKVNKSANRVILRYAPLSLVIRCHRERSRSLNRFLALRELVDRIEMKVSPESSERLREIGRLRKKKARREERSAEKYPAKASETRAGLTPPSGSGTPAD